MSRLWKLTGPAPQETRKAELRFTVLWLVVCILAALVLDVFTVSIPWWVLTIAAIAVLLGWTATYRQRQGV